MNLCPCSNSLIQGFYLITLIVFLGYFIFSNNLALLLLEFLLNLSTFKHQRPKHKRYLTIFCTICPWSFFEFNPISEQKLVICLKKY